ncbi:MAG: hypothetical protein K6U00_05990, partial [Armatimonadetes bacterium]|nr:hypothetical protein [Armatimonadota bacterium]
EARYTEAVKTSVKFTHKSWEYMNQVKDKKFLKKRIVGWWHTHPGFGIFLSSFDTFIHSNFFNLPWQIAFVIDPVSGKDGFFRWKDGQIVRCPGYYLQGGAVTTMEPKHVAADTHKERRDSRFGMRELLITAEAAIICWLLIARVWLPVTRPPISQAPSPPQIRRAEVC